MNNFKGLAVFTLLAVGGLYAQKTTASENIADFSNHPLHEYMNIEGAKALSSALSSIRGDCRKGVDLDSKRCQRGFDRTLKDLKEYGFNITKSDLSDPRLYTLADQLEDDLKQKIRDLKKSGDRDAANQLFEESHERKYHLRDKSNRAPENATAKLDAEIERINNKLEAQEAALIKRGKTLKGHTFANYFTPEGVNALTLVLKEVPQSCRGFAETSNDCETTFKNAMKQANYFGFSDITIDELSSPIMFSLYNDLSDFKVLKSKIFSKLTSLVHDSWLSDSEKNIRLKSIEKKRIESEKRTSVLISKFRSGMSANG